MAFVYFHKSTQEFQFVLLEHQDFEWNDCYEVDGANLGDTYALEDGVPVFVKTLSEEEKMRHEASIAEYEAKLYQMRRAAEYPPIADYLDGIVKGDKSQIDKYIADCLVVKAKYPKPEIQQQSD